MFRFDQDRWHALSPLLDESLDLDDSARATWLAEIARARPDLHPILQRLLHEHDRVRGSDFLESALTIEDTPNFSLAGHAIGPYMLEAPLGAGGMGTVWRARRSDGRFEGHVAVKLLNLALLDGHGDDRFRREGTLLARLAHPNIARLLDAGVTLAGQPYLVLEYVDGVRIDHFADDRRLDPRARLELFLQVADAVAHAHAGLVAHRDLKPSNILVRPDGQIKLLDFGIGKLLEGNSVAQPSATLAAAQALTPEYASPEQARGDPVTAATDVYSLGVLLYTLLTGRHPTGDGRRTTADHLRALLDEDPLPASAAVAGPTRPEAAEQAALRQATPERLRRLYRGDIDNVLAKTLEKVPERRYASVTALTDDIRRFLNHEPLKVRGQAWSYRAAKFVRRNRVAVTAVLAVVMSLSVGLYAANRQRVIAERRFDLVREVANKLFDIDGVVRTLPGSVAARQLIVDTSRDYLARLTEDAYADPELALDVGTAYLRLARVQGVPISSNLGQVDQAEQTLQTSKRLIDSVIAARPGDRVPMVRQAQIAHDRMILAGLRRPDDDALPLALESSGWLERYLDSGSVEVSEALQVVITLNNVGNRLRIEGRFDEAVRLTRRGLNIATAAPNLRAQLGGLWIGLARIHRDRGVLDQALEASANAVKTLDPSSRAPGTSSRTWPYTYALALVDQAEILGLPHGINLGRPAEAISQLQRAFAIADEAAHRDAQDAQSRGLVSTAGRMLAGLVRATNAGQALDVYDHVLRHLAEVPNNPRFRRDEVRAFSGSAGVLIRLARRADARQQLDAAFSRLRDLKMYPSDRIEPGSEPQDALVALADYQASAGDVAAAVETTELLLRSVFAAQPESEIHLGEAAEISQLYSSVAAIQRRCGRADRADALDGDRVQLWEHWDRKLPKNPFVMTQLEAARRSPQH